MDLDPVKSGDDGVLGSPDVVSDDAGNFDELECTGAGIGLFAGCRVGVARRFCCRRGNRCSTAEKIRMNEAAHVPELQYDSTACIVNGVRHGLPRLDLFRRPDTRRRRPARAFLGDAGRFGDKQPRSRTLAVILSFQGRDRHMDTAAAAARQRSHQDAIGRGNGAKLNRVEQCRHGGS